jgi:lipopolysaccharide exporter
MGTWAVFLTITAIFEATKTNLLKNAHIRFVSSSSDEDEKIRIASTSFMINLGITIIFIALVIFGSQWLSQWLHMENQLSSMLMWFIPGFIGMVLFSHLEAVQQSNLDFKGVFAGYFSRQLLFFAFILSHFLFRLPFTLEKLALYQSISIAAGTAVIFFHTRKYLSFRFEFSQAWMKKIMGYGGYIFGSGLMSNIFANLDQIMIAKFMLPASVAHYNAASRINGFVDIPSYAATEVIFPKLSKASVEDGPERVRYLYERMVAVLLCFTIPAALFIIMFPTFVINIIAGPKYQDAALILQLYMVTGLLRPMQNQAANLLNSVGKPGLCFWINTFSLAAYMLINYVCLTLFGFYGAAIGTLITSILGMCAWYVVMKKEINFTFNNIFLFIIDTYKTVFRHGKQLLFRQAPAII